MVFKQKNTFNFLIILIVSLIIIGTIFIYSSSSFAAIIKFNSQFYYLKKHCIGLCCGIILFIFINLFSLDWLKENSLLILSCNIALTACTLLKKLNFSVHSSSRWINLHFLKFQPSEFLKIAVIIFMASFLSRKNIKLQSKLKTYLPLLILILLITFILLKQPDFGSLFSIILTILILLFLAQLKLKELYISILLLTPIIFFIIYLQPYRYARIISYLNPWNDPANKGFQIIQSLIALGTGGLFGKGIGASSQKFMYLPMQQTDFIFSIIGEESGFVGLIALIIIFYCIIYYIFKISYCTVDLFSKFLLQGAATFIAIQSILSMLVTTGLIPTKGISLPFLSYGNSALCSNFLLLGLIYNCSKESYKK